MTATIINKNKYFMEQAIEQAKLAAAENEVPIGAVIEYKGEILSTGRNRRIQKSSAIAHAEIEAIEAAAKKLGDWRLEGMSLYVTIEPCVMCAGAIIHSRIKQVIYGCAEPKMGGVESIFKIFDHSKLHHKPKYIKGVMEDECRKLLRDFFKKKRFVLL
jgi:tRNA(adenine34) deaminase